MIQDDEKFHVNENENKKMRILFLCTHNSARSQMAEAFVKSLFNDKFEVVSAGIEPTIVNPHVIKAMAEINIDISNNKTNNVIEFLDMDFDCVITVCDSAKEACPNFPGARNFVHKSFTDPASLSGTDDEILEQIRKIRDDIKNWVEDFFGDHE